MTDTANGIAILTSEAKLVKPYPVVRKRNTPFLLPEMPADKPDNVSAL